MLLEKKVEELEKEILSTEKIKRDTKKEFEFQYIVIIIL